MKLSRFFAATNREALRQVRLALGPDALIVSNRRVNGGVEIVAADQTAVSENIADASKPIEESSGLQNLEQEQPLLDALGTMKGELLGRIDDLLWGSQLSDAPRVLSLFQTLLGFGFSTTLLRAMLKKLPPHLTGVAALQWARSELIKHLPL
ncbi:MAG TPA: flagellar biosynthesis protein FlhF, partial [Burkholderiaceae bacterium]|nr:flagellar biosynthesis protein FlhF [Burkholderiaceae bacterium]